MKGDQKKFAKQVQKIELAQALTHHKKGLDGNSISLVISFVVLIIILAVGALVLGSVRDTTGANTTERNATLKGLEGVQQYVNLTPTLGTVLGATVILTVIIGLFAVFGRR